jgi:hypothetical protein
MIGLGMTPLERERVRVAPIIEKLVENRLRWFRHVERRPVDAVVRRVDQMEESQVKRGRGRPKKTIRETIRKDLEVNELDPNMVFDRTLWLGCCCCCIKYFTPLP